MRTHLKSPVIYFLGRKMSLNEACAKLMKIVIENYLPGIEGYPIGADPYKWLAGHLRRNEFTVRKWTYEWKKTGTMPPVDTFLYIIQLSESSVFIDFARSLVNTVSCFPCESIKPLVTISNNLNTLSSEMENLLQEKIIVE